MVEEEKAPIEEAEKPTTAWPGEVLRRLSNVKENMERILSPLKPSIERTNSASNEDNKRSSLSSSSLKSDILAQAKLFSSGTDLGATEAPEEMSSRTEDEEDEAEAMAAVALEAAEAAASKDAEFSCRLSGVSDVEESSWLQPQLPKSRMSIMRDECNKPAPFEIFAPPPLPHEQKAMAIEEEASSTEAALSRIEASMEAASPRGSFDTLVAETRALAASANPKTPSAKTPNVPRLQLSNKSKREAGMRLQLTPSDKGPKPLLMTKEKPGRVQKTPASRKAAGDDGPLSCPSRVLLTSGGNGKTERPAASKAAAGHASARTLALSTPRSVHKPSVAATSGVKAAAGKKGGALVQPRWN